MVVASLSVGIQDYVDPYYMASDKRLRFASNDASAFNAYAVAAWRTDQAKHFLHLDRDGTLPALEQSVEEMAGLGHIDLLVVYFSGHGDKDAGGRGWFCLADAAPGVPCLDGGSIYKLLARLNARNVVLIIDCCYAELVVQGCDLFTPLGQDDGRLFICSTRANQKAWEEDGLSQGIFSHFLLFGLSTVSPIASSTGYVDLDASMFPYLRKQVALRAYAAKRGAHQQPLKGGYVSDPIEFPTVASQAMGRELSVLEALRARLRRIVVVASLIVVTILTVADLLVYHIDVDAAGKVVVRPGPHSLFHAMPYHFSKATDTGVTVAALDTSSREKMQRLASGHIWGVRSHVDHNGLRSWHQKLVPFLNKPTAWTLSMLATGHTPDSIESPDEEESTAPLELLLFLGEGDEHRSLSVAKDLYEIPYFSDATEEEIRHSDDPTAVINFQVLQPQSSIFSQDLLWVAATSPSEQLYASVRKMVILAAYRRFHNDMDEEGHLGEYKDLGRALWVIRQRRGEQPVLFEATREELRSMTQTWCRQWALLALGLLGDQTDRKFAEEGFLETVKGFDLNEQGDVLTLEQQMAMEALAMLALGSPLSSGTVQGVFRFVGDDERRLNATPAFVEWLAAVSALQALPEEVLRFLLTELNHPNAPHDFSQLEAFNILARGAKFLSPEDFGHLIAWLEGNARDYSTQDKLADGLGHMSVVAPVRDEWLRLIARRIEPSVFQSSALPATTLRGTMIVWSTDHAQGVALGRIAQGQELDEEGEHLLAQFALQRPHVEDRLQVIRGLASNADCPSENLAVCLHRRLIDTKSESELRALEIDIGVQRVLMESAAGREALLASLFDRWSSETEPEVRIALARLIGQSRLASLLSGFN